MDACTDAIQRVASIYVLRDPRDGRVRYVGASANVGHRLSGHLYDALRKKTKSQRPVAVWIRSLHSLRLQPQLEVVEQVAFGTETDASEKKWIRHYRDAGELLLNQTDGGKGLCGHSFTDAHRQKIAAAISNRITKPCDQCLQPFSVKPSEIANGNRRFCSRACYQAWQRGRTKAVPKRPAGFVVWNKGIPRTAAEKQKMSDAKRGVR